MGVSDGFGEAEWAFLTETLRLKNAAEADPLRSLPVAAFMHPERCRTLLDQLGPIIGSSSRRTTASLLSKRLAFLMTGSCLYALSACDRGLDVSPDNCVIEYGHDNGSWTSSLPLHDLVPRVWREGEREASRDAIVRTLFAELLTPLWDVLHQVSGVPRRMLWENTAVRIYSLYERRMASLAGRAATRRDADFDFLLGAEPAWFGMPFNPLHKFRFRPIRMGDGAEVRFRRTCCLYFQATCPQDYCRACPLLHPRKAS